MKTTLFMVCCIATQMMFVDLKVHRHNITSANNKVPAHSYGTGNQHATHSVSIGSRPHYRHGHNPNGSSEYHSGQGKFGGMTHSKSRNTAYQRHSGYLPQRGDTAMENNYSNIFRTTKISSINRNIDDPESQRGKIFYSQEQNYPRDSDGLESLDEHVPQEYNHNMQNQINFAHPSSLIQRKQEHTQSNNNVLFHHEPTPSINVDSRIIHVNPDEEQMYQYAYTDRALPEENMRLLDLDEQNEEVQDSHTNSLSSMDPSIMRFQEEQSKYNFKSEGSVVENGAQDALGSIEINSGTLIDGGILPSPHHTDSVDFEDDYQHPQYSVLKSKDYHPPQERNHNQYLQEIKFGTEKKSDQWENEGESNMKGEEGILLYPHRHSKKVQNYERDDLYYIPRYLSANKTRSSIRNGDDTSKKDKNELDDDIKWKSSAESGSMNLKKLYDENKIVDNVAQEVLFKPMITGGDNGISTVHRSPLEGSGDSQMALLHYTANPYMSTNTREILLPSRHRYTELHHPHWQDISHSKYLSNTNLQGDEATCKCCGAKLFYTYPELRPPKHDFHEVNHNIQNIHLPGNAKYSDAHKTQIVEPNPGCSRIAVAQQSHRNLYQWNTADDFLLQTQ